MLKATLLVALLLIATHVLAFSFTDPITNVDRVQRVNCRDSECVAVYSNGHIQNLKTYELISRFPYAQPGTDNKPYSCKGPICSYRNGRFAGLNPFGH
jgi:hypothetical protein